MRRLGLLIVFLLAGPALADDPNPMLDEAKGLMREGLERELPSPAPRGPAQWPSPKPAPVQPEKGEPPKKDALGERLRNEASLRARTAAEERRAAPENSQGAGQNRTRAAKSVGPKPRPPRP